ncbi:hypothetical protein VNO77_04010 [Canavalia gladiata]|uniref:Uncharacterized protein n=1 Tax=Canavalia gladiata TaxID=3824 RepID=A0AAN9N0X8_CANGL
MKESLDSPNQGKKLCLLPAVATTTTYSPAFLCGKLSQLVRVLMDISCLGLRPGSPIFEQAEVPITFDLVPVVDQAAFPQVEEKVNNTSSLSRFCWCVYGLNQNQVFPSNSCPSNSCHFAENFLEYPTISRLVNAMPRPGPSLLYYAIFYQARSSMNSEILVAAVERLQPNLL